MRLFAAVALLFGLAELGGGLLLEQRLARWTRQQVVEDLDARLDLVTASVQASCPTSTPLAQAMALALAEGGRARVTLIRRDGTVLADSSRSAETLDQMENHAQRVEVLEALERGHGRSLRYSHTLGRELMYAAHRTDCPDGPRVVRLAYRADEVQQTLSRVRGFVWVGGATTLFLALLITALGSHLAAREMEVLGARVRSLAGPGEDEEDRPTLMMGLSAVERRLNAAIEGLAQRRALLAATLDALNEGVILFGDDGRCARVNKAARDLLGEVKRRGTPAEVLRSPEGTELVHRALRGEDGSITLALRDRSLFVQALPLEQGGAILVLRDVTERERMDRMRRDFVANVSHELRTPVASVLAAAETLESIEEEERAARSQFTGVVVRNAKRLHALLQDLLTLSRLDAQVGVGDLEDVELRAVVDVAVEWTEGGAKVECPPELRVVADARALERVLVNLLDNAHRHGAEQGRVEVSASATPRGIEIRVEDDGPGVPPSHRERVFERFHRVDEARSRDSGGTGLGLSIAKHLVEGMGGRMECRSSPLGGAAFLVLLTRPRN